LESEACRRAEKYINGLKDVIADAGDLVNKLNSMGLNGRELLDAIKRYSSDAEYYLQKGDCETALTAISYAEGLLDSLNYLGIAKIEWKPARAERKVLIAGTFDILHPGHIEFIRYASTLGRLYVIIARDANAAKNKGRPIVFDEASRLKIMSSIRYVYKAVLGDKEDYFKPIEEIKPDIIVLGPDQPFKEEELAQELEKRLGYKPEVKRFSSKLEFNHGLKGTSDVLKRICNNICPYLTRQ